MPTTFIESAPHELSPLAHCTLPQTLEDISVQMDIVKDEPDIEVAHKEADRLLLKALEMCGYNLNTSDVEHIANIISAFHRTEKYYV